MGVRLLPLESHRVRTSILGLAETDVFQLLSGPDRSAIVWVDDADGALRLLGLIYPGVRGESSFSSVTFPMYPSREYPCRFWKGSRDSPSPREKCASPTSPTNPPPVFQRTVKRPYPNEAQCPILRSSLFQASSRLHGLPPMNSASVASLLMA